MKTVKFVLCLCVALGILFGICACAWAEVYPCAFTVESLDYEEDEVIFCDMIGHQ